MDWEHSGDRHARLEVSAKVDMLQLKLHASIARNI
jgi:hypothetical protein